MRAASKFPNGPKAAKLASVLKPLLGGPRGDNRVAVSGIAAKLGIEQQHAECSPEEKLTIIEQAQQRGERVVMIGDGINDAPVLAGADTSVAPLGTADTSACC